MQQPATTCSFCSFYVSSLTHAPCLSLQLAFGALVVRTAASKRRCPSSVSRPSAAPTRRAHASLQALADHRLRSRPPAPRHAVCVGTAVPCSVPRPVSLSHQFEERLNGLRRCALLPRPLSCVPVSQFEERLKSWTKPFGVSVTSTLPRAIARLCDLNSTEPFGVSVSSTLPRAIARLCDLNSTESHLASQ